MSTQCPTDKILNSITGMYVSKTGKIGKLLVKHTKTNTKTNTKTKTKHRNTRYRGRKQSRRVVKRTKQCGGSSSVSHIELTEQWMKNMGKLQTQITELTRQKDQLQTEKDQLQTENNRLQDENYRFWGEISGSGTADASADAIAVVAAAAKVGPLPPSDPINKQDDRGWTKLYQASFEGKPAVVERLLVQRADPNIPDKVSSRIIDVHVGYRRTLTTGNQTPVWTAAAASQTKTVAGGNDGLALIKLLVAGGADLTIPDARNFTPLAWADFCVTLSPSYGRTFPRKSENARIVAKWIRAQGVTK
jgi:hypothetical protein